MKNDINKEEAEQLSCHRHDPLDSAILTSMAGLEKPHPGSRKPRKNQKDARTSLPSGVCGSRCLTTAWGHSGILARPPTTELSQAVDVSRMVPFLVKHLSCRFDELVMALADAR